MVHVEIYAGTHGDLLLCKPILVFSFDPKLNKNSWSVENIYNLKTVEKEGERIFFYYVKKLISYIFISIKTAITTEG